MLAPRGEVRELVRTALLQEQGLQEIPKYTAILCAIGRGRTTVNEIAQGAGLAADTPLRDKLDRLAALDYVRAARNLEAKAKEPYRYRVSDPAFRFYYEFVAPWESMLATQPVAVVWERHIAPALDGYMGLVFVFEMMVEQAYTSPLLYVAANGFTRRLRDARRSRPAAVHARRRPDDRARWWRPGDYSGPA